MAVLAPFNDFPEEAALVGKLLAGYAVLEIDLMHCVNAVRHDESAVIKALFANRGEERRINGASDMARTRFLDLGLQDDFDRAMSALHHCRKLRNQYAHCVWWNDNTPNPAFRAAEAIAGLEGDVSLAHLEPHHVSIQLLEQQLDYFEYTDDLLLWLIREARRLQGLNHHAGIERPADRPQPAMRVDD